MSVMTPFGFFLRNGKCGASFAAMGMRDANAVTHALRVGRTIKTERAVLVRGKADTPTAESVTIVTLTNDPR